MNKGFLTKDVETLWEVAFKDRSAGGCHITDSLFFVIFWSIIGHNMARDGT